MVKTNLAGVRPPRNPLDLFRKPPLYICCTLMTVLDLCAAISAKQEAPSPASGSHVPWVFVLTDAPNTRGTKCGHKKDNLPGSADIT